MTSRQIIASAEALDKLPVGSVVLGTASIYGVPVVGQRITIPWDPGAQWRIDSTHYYMPEAALAVLGGSVTVLFRPDVPMSESSGQDAEYIRSGVCLLCGGAVLMSGGHLDPDRHAAEVKRIVSGTTAAVVDREAGRHAAEYGTVSTIEGRRAAAPSRERRAALAAQRVRLVSPDSKVGKSRHGR